MAWVEKRRKGWRVCDRVKDPDGNIRRVSVNIQDDSEESVAQGLESLREKCGAIISGIRQYDDTFYVYYILDKDNDMVKIGCSSNPDSRLKSMQTATGNRLALLHSIPLDNRKNALMAERSLHKAFAHSACHAHNEWFAVTILYELRRDYWTRERLMALLEVAA